MFGQDIYLGGYPGTTDGWMGVICSQGSSLLSVDISGSDITDSGLVLLKDCPNLQNLIFDYCGRISDRGLENIQGISASSNSDVVVFMHKPCFILYQSNFSVHIQMCLINGIILSFLFILVLAF